MNIIYLTMQIIKINWFSLVNVYKLFLVYYRNIKIQKSCYEFGLDRYEKPNHLLIKKLSIDKKNHKITSNTNLYE